MNIETLPTDEELIFQDKLSRVVIWGSRFKFLMEHHGIRPGRVSYLMGTTGSGKTSLTIPIITDAAKEAPVLVILTEEDVLRYMPYILKASPSVNRDNLKFILESEIPEEIRESFDMLSNWLEAMIIESGAKIVFWDNITTSAFYSQRFGVKGQEKAVLKIQDLAKSLNVAFFIVIHTKKDVSDNQGKLIQGEDVRGSQQSFISADHFYILQRFTIGSSYYSYMRTVKHRGYPTIYKDHLLLFSDGVFKSDNRVTFEEINDIFINRNVLGKKKEKSEPKKKGYWND